MKSKKEKNVRGERGETIRAYFVRLFGKYDFRNEEHFLYFGKWLIFILLLLVESLAILQRLANMRGWGTFTLLLIVIGALTASVATHLFVVKEVHKKIPFYIFDFILACAFLFLLGGGVYALIIYMLVLTQVYFEYKSTKRSLAILGVSILLYIVAYGLQYYFVHGQAVWNILQLLSLTFGFLVGIITHFLAVQIVLAFYRQYLKLDGALKELSESKKELEKAYAVVAEVSALEERQRIAKEIHDTVGHSLTTVIMQTETAKRMLDDNPEEAKSKLVSANLRARQALEEIRDGVHLLSGNGKRQTLSQSLWDIVHKSTDGTGIAVRSEIADLSVSPAKSRFLCNTLKEGISNGLRHGGATAFWFELKEEEGKISFLLSDNGRGGGGTETLGFGLTTMRERARELGGEVVFSSEDEEGFEIFLTLPADGGNYGEN